DPRDPRALRRAGRRAHFLSRRFSRHKKSTVRVDTPIRWFPRAGRGGGDLHRVHEPNRMGTKVGETVLSSLDSLEALIETAKEAERLGASDDALRCYEAAFARLPGEADAATAASLLRWIGSVHRHRGDLDAAQEVYDASL